MDKGKSIKSTNKKVNKNIKKNATYKKVDNKSKNKTISKKNGKNFNVTTANKKVVITTNVIANEVNKNLEENIKVDTTNIKIEENITNNNLSKNIDPKNNKPVIEEFIAPLKKSKIFKHKKPKTFHGIRTGNKVEMKKNKPVIKFKKKLTNKLKGIRYDKDGVEVRVTLKSRLVRFLKKRGKKSVKKKFKTQLKNWWGSLGGVSKVAVISIGGIGITAAVAIPTVLANTIWKADNYKVEIDKDYSSFISLEKQDPDTNGNLIFKLTINKAGSYINGISSVKKGDYSLAHKEGATEFEEKKHEYTFDQNEKKLKIFKDVIGTHKGDISITPSLSEFAITTVEVNSTTSKHKNSFCVGEKFSSDGLVLKVTYEDGKSDDVTSGFTTDFDGVTFTDTNLGQQNITVSYKGFTCSYDISIEPVYEKEIVDSDTGLKYCKIKDTNNWIVKWDGVTALDRNLDIQSGEQTIGGETVNIIAIQTNGFKNAVFKDGTADIKITVDAYDLEYIGAGAFDNENINQIIVNNYNLLWNIEDSDKSYSFDEYSEEHPEFPAIYADLFKGELKDKIVLNSKRLTFGTPSFESLYIGVGIGSAPESGSCSTIIKIPTSIKIGNYVFTVDFFNADNTIGDVTEIYIPFSILSIGSDTFIHADSLQKAHFTNPYYWKANGSILIGLDNELTAATTLKGVPEENDIEVDFQDIDEVVYEKNVSSEDAIVYHKDHSTNDGCALLQNVFIPSEQLVQSFGNMPVKSIKYKDNTRGAFQDCTNLESVVLPRSLTLIDANAFKGCTNLKSIYYTGTKSEWNSASFEKKTGWHEGCLTTKVICIDGELSLN